MIILDVEEYCNNCTEFEADIRKATFESFCCTVDCETVIYCEHRDRCANMINYLKTKQEK